MFRTRYYYYYSIMLSSRPVSGLSQRHEMKS